MRAATCFKTLLPFIGLLGFVSAHAGVIRGQDIDQDYVPTGKGWGEYRPANQHAAGKGGKPSGGVKGNGINYHGGPLMLGTTKVYYIWYGNWDGNTATNILPAFAGSIGGSDYYNINTTYYDGSNTHVTNAVNLAGQAYDNYSRGTALSDAQVQSVVTDAINNGLPKDPNAVYFVLTSADVNETSGFCTQYCGWHTHASFQGVEIKYSFVGNPDRCPSACAVQTTGPNGNAGADGMASIVAHELEEAVTDPVFTGWYDRRGYENADKCAWKFGTTYKTSNGAYANVNLNGVDYLIQQNWVNAGGGYCAMAYP
jgi:hypothetical protein